MESLKNNTDATSTTTFWELINNKINIPIIQRDYAQGRAEEKDRRDKFLGVLYNHLTNNSSLDLDFVYGRIEKNVEKNVFFPIDGQQRLTTLFLLHWYIAMNEGIEKQEFARLENFVYDTRISSRDFCEAIIKEDIQIPQTADENGFIAQIKNYFWYKDTWKSDPTIQAMLIMLQAIHEKFHATRNLWHVITQDKITFQILDLGAKGFELTDELYIKMNARGKQLTDFENFKASFIQFIEKTYKDTEKYNLPHPRKKDETISYGGYFSDKIEKEWTDLFWQYRKKDEFVIDDACMNYVEFVAQMFYFIENKDAKAEDFKFADFSIVETVFSKKEALLFLFNSLDWFYKISLNDEKVDKEQIDLFFSSLFQKGKIGDDYRGQVGLFGNDIENINLFQRCLLGQNFDNQHKMFLFSILFYTEKWDVTDVQDNLRYYIRVIRNLLLFSTRVRVETEYSPNPRINDFGKHWNFFEKLAQPDIYRVMLDNQIDNSKTEITNDAVKYEKEKAQIIIDNLNNTEIIAALFKLEEFHYFGGLIHQLKPKENVHNLVNYSKIVREIWTAENSLLTTRALIVCGFGGYYIKRVLNYTVKSYLWGDIVHWHTILTGDSDRLYDNQGNHPSDCIIKLLNTYLQTNGDSPAEKLQTIVDNKLATYENRQKDWIYYFLKYVEPDKEGLFYTAWISGSKVEFMNNKTRTPLLGYHISPYVKIVSERLSDDVCKKANCSGESSYRSALRLENGVCLSCEDNGWKIKLGENYLLNDDIKKKYNIENDFLLKETDEKDKIEIAEDFCNDIYK